MNKYTKFLQTTNAMYKDFSSNSDNYKKCDDCPWNRRYDIFEKLLPCGLATCWVNEVQKQEEK